MKMGLMLLLLIVAALCSLSVLGNDIFKFSGSNQNCYISNHSTLPTNPFQFAQNITIKANVTDDNDSIQWVNFTLTSPSGIKVIDNVNGTRFGDFWNSSHFVINESGYWNYTIVSSDDNPINLTPATVTRSINVVDEFYHTPSEMSSTIPINYNSSYTFNLWTSTNVQLNWTVEHTLDGNISINFSHAHMLINSTQYTVLYVNVSSSAASEAGLHSGNIIFKRQYPFNLTAEAVQNIPVNVSISSNYGDVEFVNDDGYTFSACPGTILHSKEVVNLGNYAMTDCTPTLVDGVANILATGTVFTLGAGSNASAQVTYSYGGGTVQTFFKVTCTASPSGGQDTTSTTPEITFIQGGDCGGGGGGGSLYVAPAKPYVPPPVNITFKCGDGICDESAGENYETCILDCAQKQMKLEDVFCMPLFNCGSWKTQGFSNIVILGLLGGMVYFTYESRKPRARLKS